MIFHHLKTNFKIWTEAAKNCYANSTEMDQLRQKLKKKAENGSSEKAARLAVSQSGLAVSQSGLAVSQSGLASRVTKTGLGCFK